MLENPINQRLNIIVKNSGKTTTKLAEYLEVSQSGLNNAVRGKNGIGVKLLLALHKLNVNYNWLLTGEGEIYKGCDQKNISGDGNQVNVGQYTNSTNSVINNQDHTKEIAYLKEQVELLKSQLEDKERLIQLYEAQNK